MRLSKEDWLKLGINILTKYGPEAIKIERLCAGMNVTKGSFYHHFAHRDDFIACLLDFWQEQNTQAIITQVDTIAEIEARSDKLDFLARHTDTGPEVAIRAWAQFDVQVAARVKAVDEQRLAYLEHLIGSLVPQKEKARLMAQIAYAHFVGAQHLTGLIAAGEWAAMDSFLRSLMLNVTTIEK